MNTNKFCDCSQGRFPCSCNPNLNAKRPEILMSLTGTTSRDSAFRSGFAGTFTRGPIMIGDELLTDVLGLPPEDPQNYFRDLSAKQGKELADNWVELNALKWKIQISQGLAILGWAAAILLALGV